MESHTSLILVNRRKQRLRYEYHSAVLFLDNDRVALSNRAQQAVLWLLLTNLGRTISHQEICATLDQVGRGNSDELPNTRSGKFMATLRRSLSVQQDLRDLIKTVRADGYIVDEAWSQPTVTPRDNQSNDFLATLDRVVSDCIDHANKSPLITCANGLQYIDFDPDFALQKFSLLNVMLWDTIRSLASTAQASDLSAIKNTFHVLASYVLYWRLGDELTEQKWKSDYRDEITTQARTLRRQVDELTKLDND